MTDTNMIIEAVKRYEIKIPDQGVSFPCPADETILSGIEKAGKKGIQIGCRCGGCGVCKVRLLSGRVELSKMSRAHVSAGEQEQGIVLACCAKPKSDVSLLVLGI